jgi:uncharacterized protein YcbK (DUF882 family)
MGDVSKHFNRAEFACSCGCGFDAVDIDLLSAAELVCEEFGPVIVHCACRCITYNREIGSKDTSQHPKAKAIDFHINGVEPEKIAYWLDKKFPDSCGIIIYNWGVHFDIRQKKYRNNNRRQHDST